jgi:hypothetical protein
MRPSVVQYKESHPKTEYFTHGSEKNKCHTLILSYDLHHIRFPNVAFHLLFINTILRAFPPSLCLLTHLTISYSFVWSPKHCFVKGTNHPVTKYLICTCILFSHLDDGTDFSYNTVIFTGSFLYQITTVSLLAILICSC